MPMHWPPTTGKPPPAHRADRCHRTQGESRTDGGYGVTLASHVVDLLRAGVPVLVNASTIDRAHGRDLHVGGGDGAAGLAVANGHWLNRVLTQVLDAWGLSYLQSISPGVALCRLHSDAVRLDGMQVSLKGGPMGLQDIFEQLLHGRPWRFVATESILLGAVVW